MVKVTTFRLSADLTAAAPGYDAIELGALDATQLVELLARFTTLDSVQNAEADPHLVLATPAGSFLVRTGQGRLYLYNARDTTEPYVELTPGEIVAHLDRLAPTGTSPATATAPEPAVVPAAPNRGIAVAILAAGLALNGYTLYSVFYTESVHETITVTLLTDPAELAAQRQQVTGTYATGDRPGDRVIQVGADGRVAFSEIGAARSVNNGTDHYRLGRREKRLCLTTPDSGVIDIVNIDTLLYYRDTYKRR